MWAKPFLAVIVLHGDYIFWNCAKSQQIWVVGLIFEIHMSKESFLCNYKSTVYIICKLVMSFTWVFIRTYITDRQRRMQKVGEYVFSFTTCHNCYKRCQIKCKYYCANIELEKFVQPKIKRSMLLTLTITICY